MPRANSTKIAAPPKPEKILHTASTIENTSDESYTDSADEYVAPVEVHRIPADQLQLTPEQQNEVFTKVITAVDPNVSRAVSRFDYSDGSFKPKPIQSHTQCHFSMDGTLLHIDSDEAKEQAQWLEQINPKIVSFKSTHTENDDNPGANSEESEDIHVSKVRSLSTSTGTAPALPERALKNQFNYSERASATINPAMRDRAIATEPPPTVDYSAQVTHWEIVDTYIDELEKTISAREAKEKSGKAKKSSDDDDIVVPSTASNDILNSVACAVALKTMERLINQNADAIAFNDYAYYDDDSEGGKSTGGFLPLWKFSSTLSATKTVTAIEFNPLFNDLFAVGYGSYEFGRSVPGTICVYTMKNTTYPEYSFSVPSGVMCMAWHPEHAALLCIGLYDGTVCVYDVRSCANPLFVSNEPDVIHRDPVWQVIWDSESLDNDGKPKALSFYSVSSDGFVKQWICGRQQLHSEVVVTLKRTSNPTDSLNSSSLITMNSGSSADFNPHAPHLFVVGTEEGSIQLYSKEFNNSHFVREYNGHDMTVYSVKWNPFHPGVFISCSADWSVKLWEMECTTPIMSFDLGCAVSDVCWSPYRSSMFCIVTIDGKIRMYDLSVNKHDAISEYKLTGRNRLTHITFNTQSPIICVGDERGVVIVLKLTHSLRRMNAPSISQLDISDEATRLDRLLIIPTRSTLVDEELPAYLRQFLNGYASEKEAADKLLAAQKSAAIASAQGTKSTPSSPKARAAGDE